MPVNASGLQALRGLPVWKTGRADRSPRQADPPRRWLGAEPHPGEVAKWHSRQIGELPPSRGRTLQRFHLRYFAVTTNRGLAVLDEAEIEAVDLSAVILAVAEIPWPLWAVGLRVVDDKGHPVFERLKSEWQLPQRD
jgi:hypothetical protein